ncbi:MAG: right-handed parallel beta-helix repeat-containing protein [Candidatus Moranbacteria bacterium]|nr:right-handed parallel beta-helix repeat-containing protein [Candidatus Moranbacteria bacterium]
MKIFYNFFIWLFPIFVMSFLVFGQALAKDYDIYVDADASGSEDGSEDNPYSTIFEAITKADEEDEIYIDKGEYDENIVIDKEVSLFGDDLKEVIIDGQIEIKKNVEAQNFTIDGNVIVKSGADIIFDNLVIKEASGVAVNAYAGNGEIVIKNSTIKRAGTKGIYAQKGRDIIISGCNIYSNEEEGIDLRSNVDGVVSGNNIYDNGESGIEFIVSDSGLQIKNNTVKNNGSSGIAAQYYEEFDEKGEIAITGNTISGNDKYGLDCNRPQGGDPDADYWSKSIIVTGNNFSGNDDGDMNKYCALVQAAPEVTEEQKKEQEEKRQKEIEENQEEKEVQEQIMEQNRQKTVQENEQSLNKLVVSKKELKEAVAEEKEKIEGRGGLVTFFVGPNYKAINNIKEVASGFGAHLSDFDDLDRKLIEDKNHKIAQDEMDDIMIFVKEVNDLIVEKYNKFSLFGWLFKIFS